MNNDATLREVVNNLIDVETAIEKQTEVLTLVLEELRKLNLSPAEKLRLEDRP